MNEKEKTDVSKEEKNKKEVKHKESKPLNQWIALNKVTTTYKWMALGAFLSSLVLSLLLLVIPFKKPTVVFTDGKNVEFFSANYSDVALGKKDVAKVVKDFIRYRYNWMELNPEATLRNLSPITSSGLIKKLEPKLKHLKAKEIGNKKVSQLVTENIHIEVTDKEVLARFFVVLVIEGKPIAAPSELSFHVVKGARSKWNPRGLYVNGIISHSEAL